MGWVASRPEVNLSRRAETHASDDHLSFLLGYDLNALVIATVLAHNVRLDELTAVGAGYHSGNGKLPVRTS